MTTFQDLIHETKHYLMTAQQDRLNVLDITIDNNPATVTVQFRNDLKGIAEGTVICIGLEEMHVLSVSGTVAGSTATVLRAINGSLIASHTAGDHIQVAPQFSDFRVSKYINRSLQDISTEGLFRIQSVEFAYLPSVAGYNINLTSIIDVWRVSYNTAGPANDWPIIPSTEWRMDQAANTTDFPQGVQLVLYSGGYPGHNIRVSCRTGFSPLVTLSDDVLAISGLHTEAHDIPVLGAAIDLLSGRDIKRTFLNRQPEPRRQEEVPPGAATNAMRPILGLYTGRILREARRLNRKYPRAT